MIDPVDSAGSTLRLLVAEALKAWTNSALLHIARDNDPIVRTAAARELHARGTAEIMSVSASFIRDERDFVREIGAFILGQLGTPRMPFKEASLPLLVNAFDDSSADVRAAAAAAVGHLCYESMPPVVENGLLNLAGDKSSEVRACVAFALGNSSGAQSVTLTLERLMQDEEEQVREFAELGLEMLVARRG